jgi:plasmid stabilization system protein ParE
MNDMPRAAWSPKRERQYEHIKESELDAGRVKERAEEIAARTVNKLRAEAGETKSPTPRSRGRKRSGG